jgi:FAD/FMN-containing dehydrogenase
MDETALLRLRGQLRGTLILPDDPAYDEARAVWNASIDRRPAAIVRCANRSDVERALELAHRHDLVVAVRGGGHSFAGKSTCDGGVVIDLSGMKRIDVDVVGRVARAEGGCTLADFDTATTALGLATTMGTAPPTGIGGLTLGGGLGWLMGRHGLACDNLVSADVLTADGRRVQAGAGQHEDLLWGLRGGGGNFGVVTTFEYRLHPVTTVLGGAITHPLGQARDVLRFYRDYTSATPDELTTMAGILPLATGPAFGIGACWCGEPAAGETALAPLRRFGAPIEDTIRMRPYLEMQSVLSPPPIRLASYARSSFLQDLDDATIDVLVEQLSREVPSLCLVFLEHVHGAVTRVGDAESSFAHRTRGYSLVVLTLWTEPADAERASAFVRSVFDAMAPFLRSGVYSNYLGDEGDARVRAAYGPAYDRLVGLKRRYDPTNFFRLNQNVVP